MVAWSPPVDAVGSMRPPQFELYAQSRIMLAQARGSSILTVEGNAPVGTFHPLEATRQFGRERAQHGLLNGLG